MARKKAVRRKKAAAKKVNPTVAMKARLAELTAQVKAVTSETKEVAKRTDAFIKANLTVATPGKAAPAAKKKTAKKRRKARKKAKK